MSQSTSNQPFFALIDCNNFFASCEQVFRPDLQGKPIVVLSSNDGCVVARSQEARALGIPMGAPAFKYKQLFTEYGVHQFSANFHLYGDISRRITELLTGITPRLEVYSIDESFLDISQLEIADYARWGRIVRQQIGQWVGIPISIGIGPSKTLVKLASEHAKREPSHGGVVVLKTEQDIQEFLVKTPIEDIWGVGRKYAPRLRAQGIGTAAELATLEPWQGRRLLSSVHGERLIRELRGQSCYPLERTHKDQKIISVTRTFGHDVSEQHSIEAALAHFTARASQKLRDSHQQATTLSIFATSDRHKPGYRYWHREAKFPHPTADTGELISVACRLFADIFDPAATYHRAGILLAGLQPAGYHQIDYFDRSVGYAAARSQARMAAIDSLRSRFGSNSVQYATEALSKDWQPRLGKRSPAYTTQWDELPLLSNSDGARVNISRHK